MTTTTTKEPLVSAFAAEVGLGTSPPQEVVMVDLESTILNPGKSGASKDTWDATNDLVVEDRTANTEHSRPKCGQR